ncbi:uncharacterized protein L3040_002889 [Drepanopeziza brunnea f. sp. 'multigermtubi']|nr:hypothetical protein L3040_002889 [Drepanopeziza brunnea f. sp. 'multigermtubi']
MAALTLLLLKLRTFWIPKASEPSDAYSLSESFLVGVRTIVSSSIASLAMLLGAQALQHSPNLPVLAMLPIATYVTDSLFFRMAYIVRILPRDLSCGIRYFYKVVCVLLGVLPPVMFDYRLSNRSLVFAAAGFALASLSRVVACVRPRIEPKGPQSWDGPLRAYLLAGLAPMLVAGIATSKYENVTAASHIAGSWDVAHKLLYLGPGVLLLIVFGSAMNSAYPFTSKVHVGGALEDPSAAATDAVASTLQAGFFTLAIGVFGQERNFVEWLQVIPVTLIYVVCVGPRHIGYYPPRLLNLILRLFRRRQLPLHTEPWQLLFFLATSTVIFAILISCNAMYLIDTVAHQHDLKTWHDPSTIMLDTLYRAPQLRSFDVIIAHSEGDPVEAIADLVHLFPTQHLISWLSPRVTVYSKDPSFSMTDATVQFIRGEFGGDLSIQTLNNTGGVTATFLHHIIDRWAVMSVQTIFLSTATATAAQTRLHLQRFLDYFTPMGFPLPDATPKTGFLHLGEQEACRCESCFDSLGWEDSFHLVPSMWSASRPDEPGVSPAPHCGSVMLTRGNNFVASAARIRGVKKDVWEMLYDGLVNEDLSNAWAHKKEKLPVVLPGEMGRGRFRPGEVYGAPDGLERPYLGLTVERLWGVLLQCSRPEIAWGCPSLEIRWRFGGKKGECGCLE